MSGDHNMYQKPRSYDDDTQYDESQVQAMIRKAERDDLTDFDESLLKHLFELIRARANSDTQS